MVLLGIILSQQEIVILGKGKAMVRTGLAIAILVDAYAKIAPRLGLAMKWYINVGAGVVDTDYHGKLGIVQLIM